MTDLARIITSRTPDSSQEGTTQGSGLRRGLSVSPLQPRWMPAVCPEFPNSYLSQILPEMTAIVRERDALEAQTDRLRTILETSD